MKNSFKDIDVFILCGGLGKRLRELNLNAPKPMVEIGGRPFLDIIIEYLADFGFSRFILGIGYKAGFIENYYNDRHKKGIEIIFSREKTPLGTGGAVKKARKIINSRDFLVLNGDSFYQFNPKDFLSFHKRKKSLVTILLKRLSGDAKDYGTVKIDKLSNITCFQEKNEKAKNGLINSGVYLFDNKIFNLMPRKRNFSLEHELFPELYGKGLFGYTGCGYFIDIGTPERFFKAKKHFSQHYNVKTCENYK